MNDWFLYDFSRIIIKNKTKQKRKQKQKQKQQKTNNQTTTTKQQQQQQQNNGNNKNMQKTKQNKTKQKQNPELVHGLYNIFFFCLFFTLLQNYVQQRILYIMASSKFMLTHHIVQLDAPCNIEQTIETPQNRLIKLNGSQPTEQCWCKQAIF